ncbi:unnamed protein product [Adineta steineri]|uniref:Uncharacterized protein n=2 Tax=Adineta steineri TaxID=433720 RepID=A0A815T9W7_9BILA|nr:unnamed protein product [Adineta steineri]
MPLIYNINSNIFTKIFSKVPTAKIFNNRCYRAELTLIGATLYDAITPNNNIQAARYDNIQAACDDEFASYDDEINLGPNH